MSVTLFFFYGCDSESLTVPQEELNIELLEKTEIAAKGNMPSVNGQGTVILADVSGGTFNRRFAFHANTMPDGSVSGKAVVTYIGGEGKIMYDIDCLTVDGNTAKLSGVVTSSTTNTANVGQGIRFMVKDNGEGKNADPDQISFIYISSLTCNDAGGLPLNDIDGGNIQVKN